MKQKRARAIIHHLPLRIYLVIGLIAISLALVLVGGYIFYFPSRATYSLTTQTSPTPSPMVLTLEKIFATQPETPSTATELLVTGDVLTARSINTKMTNLNDFTWPFHQTAETLRAADITFINLETPLVKDCPLTETGMIFCGDERSVEGLKFAGVDVVNLANNHAGNYGVAGVENTVNLLEENNFTVSGVHGPVYTEHNGTRFAFLGYNEVDIQPGIQIPEDDVIIKELDTATANADIVIVQFHWGQEYTYQPTRNQKRLAHLAIDHGADLIVSNHPHWFQPFEIYNHKLIAYSHGNFVFDQMWSRETRIGLVNTYTFDQLQLIKVEIKPVLIENYGQPRWLEGKEKDTVIETLKTESYRLRDTQR